MKKLVWVEILKGIGIVSVVAGHIYSSNINRYFFLFHMPLFFFLSGYLLKPKRNFKEYFIKKVKHLLIPYFAFLIPLYYLFGNFSSYDSGLFIQYISTALAGGKGLSGNLGIFWFVSSLFFSQQILNIILVKLNKTQTNIVVFLFLVISYLHSYYFAELWFVGNINSIFTIIPIMYIGYSFKKYGLITSKPTLIILLIITLLFTSQFPNNVYDIKNNVYGYPIITLFSSLVIILTLIAFSKYIARTIYLKKIFLPLGKASMVIMYVHLSIKNYLLSHFHFNTHLQLLITLLISYLIYYFLSKFYISRYIFLGKSSSKK